MIYLQFKQNETQAELLGAAMFRLPGVRGQSYAETKIHK